MCRLCAVCGLCAGRGGATLTLTQRSAFRNVGITVCQIIICLYLLLGLSESQRMQESIIFILKSALS